MKVGDLVMHCDSFSDESPVVILEFSYDPATEYGALEPETVSVARVMNEHGQRWVPVDDLVEMEVSDGR